MTLSSSTHPGRTNQVSCLFFSATRNCPCSSYLENLFSPSAHRSKNYDTLDIYTLFEIPMAKLLSSDALVAVWVTNRPKYKQFLTDKLFPSWNLEVVGEWYWMKMTTTGQPVMPLDSTHRKPYELLLVARNKASTSVIDVPEKLVFASVASQHSRKPPLNGKTPGPFFSASVWPIEYKVANNQKKMCYRSDLTL